MDVPETRYAKTADGVSIAYQVVGEGELDIVAVPPAFVSNVEMVWEWPFLASFVRGLAARGRFIHFDRRGSGLSDAVSGERLPTLEARMEDIHAVMDAVGAERAVLVGSEDGAAQCFLFAATYPERTRAIITVGASCRGLWAPDAPWARTEQEWAEWLAKIESGWGTPEFVQDLAALAFPDHAHDPEFVHSYGRLMRLSLRKADAIAAERMARDTDVRRVLPLIQAPALIPYLADGLVYSAEEARYIAEHIPGATLVELPGADGTSFTDLSYVDRLLTSLQAEESEFERALATVLFTDIVGSTKKAAEMGDKAWKELVERHHSTVRAMG